MKEFKSINEVMTLDPDTIMGEIGVDKYYREPGIVREDCNNLILPITTSIPLYTRHLGLNLMNLSSKDVVIQLVGNSGFNFKGLPSVEDLNLYYNVVRLESPIPYETWRDSVIEEHKRMISYLNDEENTYHLEPRYQICDHLSVSFVYDVKVDFHRIDEVAYHTVVIKASIFDKSNFDTLDEVVIYPLSYNPKYDDPLGELCNDLRGNINTAYFMDGDAESLLHESLIREHLLVIR